MLGVIVSRNEAHTLRADDGHHLNWPTTQVRRRFGPPRAAEAAPANQYDKTVDELHRFFGEAKAYAQKTAPEAKNPRFESMRGLFDGSQKLFIHTGAAKTMQEAVLFAEQYGMKPVLVGAAECWMITDFLKAHQVPVILAEPQRLPSREDEDYDQPYKTAAALHEAGIPFALSGNGSWRQRNLPFEAGQAVGFGLPYEAAVQSLTLSPAAILGIGGSTGSRSGKPLIAAKPAMPSTSVPKPGRRR